MAFALHARVHSSALDQRSSHDAVLECYPRLSTSRPCHYHRRSNVESVFSMTKRKFGDSVRSKTDVAMVNEVLCKFLAHNLCVLNQEECELGIETMFTKQVETTPLSLSA